MHTVAKFGGSSLADASQIKKVLAIVKSDPARHYVVVSAPGKRNREDKKITDLLYEWQKLSSLGQSSKDVEKMISDRYFSIVEGLGLSLDIKSELEEISKEISEGASPDYAASRGEYLSGKIVAEALGYEFIDAAACISSNNGGQDKKADEKLRKLVGNRQVVIPGFYGSMPDGSIKTFSRGGSDVTGAIVAHALKAEKYENWTDVCGLRMADPRVVEDPKKISVVTYRELRELAYMGANVFHEEAMFPVQEAGIPTHILNTNEPKDSGTVIVAERKSDKDIRAITGIAGRKGFSVLTIEKALMNQEIGFVRKILTILEQNGVSLEHMPSGIDTISIIIDEKKLDGKAEVIVREIQSECNPDTLEIHPNLAMIAVVGLGMAHVPGMASRIFTAVAKENINIRMINQGSSEISIFIGVENTDCENAIRAIYKAFVK
ncbi:MAG: aspartate kinase [Patescibacteria group bacterium]